MPARTLRPEDVVVLAARRTPMGAFQGVLKDLSAPELGARALAAAVAAADVGPARVDEVLLGCVLSAALGQAPARQAVRAAGLPDSVGATLVGKVCGSALQAVFLGADMLRAGSAELVAVGGMESMSQAPYLLDGTRAGYRLGHRRVLDHLLFDGLQDADEGLPMGEFAERCAERFGFDRAEQDAYARVSVERALRAVDGGAFAEEICPIRLPARDGQQLVDRDEPPGRCRPERIAELEPVFRRDGSVTAASSAGLADGAAVLLLARREQAGRLGLRPLARIVGRATYAGPPAEFPSAPIAAIRALFERTAWCDDDVDLYEINEAFAVVVLAAMRELGLDHAKVNVDGGACALGHPIGATGARLVVTLIHALRRRGLRRGVVALCIGGGEALALAVELI